MSALKRIARALERIAGGIDRFIELASDTESLPPSPESANAGAATPGGESQQASGANAPAPPADTLSIFGSQLRETAVAPADAQVTGELRTPEPNNHPESLWTDGDAINDSASADTHEVGETAHPPITTAGADLCLCDGCDADDGTCIIEVGDRVVYRTPDHPADVGIVVRHAEPDGYFKIEFATLNAKHIEHEKHLRHAPPESQSSPALPAGCGDVDPAGEAPNASQPDVEVASDGAGEDVPFADAEKPRNTTCACGHGKTMHAHYRDQCTEIGCECREMTGKPRNRRPTPVCACGKKCRWESNGSVTAWCPVCSQVFRPTYDALPAQGESTS